LPKVTDFGKAAPQRPSAARAAPAGRLWRAATAQLAPYAGNVIGLGSSTGAFQQNIGMKKQERAQDHSQIDHVAGYPPIHPPVARSRRDFSAASLRSRAQDESYGAQDKNCRYVPVARVVRQLPARAPLHARPRTKMARKTRRGARDARVFGSGKGGKTLLLLTIQQ
jgi:hypothetical protein